jgi:hypothetical protein
MKQLLVAALVALFALSFTMAQEQTTKKETTTTVATASTNATTSTAKSTDCCTGPKGCCSASKGTANMKDCPMMKGSTGASMSKADTTTAKAAGSK